MFICRCNKLIEPPDDHHIYCPYCGLKHRTPCTSEECSGNGHSPGILTLLKAPYCPTCGAIYRYHVAGTPIRQEEIYPTLSSPSRLPSTGEIPKEDLLPASGSPFSDTAIRSRYAPYLPQESPSPISDLETTALLAVQARHGLIYALAHNGLLHALDYETLRSANQWVFPEVPNLIPSTGSNARQEEKQIDMQAGESVLVVRHNTLLYGYHAGNGKELFTLHLRGITCLALSLFADYLLILGTDVKQKEIAQLYRLSELCQNRNSYAEPTTTYQLAPDLSGSRTPHVKPLDIAYHQRILHDNEFFYVSNQTHQILRIDPTITAPLPGRVFENRNDKHIRAWSLHEDRLYLYLNAQTVQERDRRETQQPETLLYYSTDPEPTTSGPQKTCPLTWKLADPPVPLLVVGDDLYAINAQREIVRVSQNDPDHILETIYALTGYKPNRPIEWVLVPNAGNPCLLIHCREQYQHRFDYVPLHNPAEARPILSVQPRIGDNVQLLYCDRYVYTINLSSGNIKRETLPHH